MPARDFAALASPDVIRVAYFALLALMTLPVAIFPVPRSSDLVNHWARLTLLTMPASDPLNAFYSVEWGAIPNLGIDLLYLALSPLISAQSVARLAFALSFWLPALGAWRLHRAFARAPSPTILIAPLLSYNVIVTAGLTNYGLGAGVALLALAWRAARPERRLGRDLLVLNLFAVALFFCHLMALAAFCLMFALMEATPREGEGLALRRAALSPLYVAAGLALAAFMRPMPAGFTLVSSKGLMLTAPFNAVLPSDMMWGAAVLALIGAFVAGRALRIARPARLALAGFAAVVALAPPSQGATVLIDARLAALWAYFALAALVPGAPTQTSASSPTDVMASAAKPSRVGMLPRAMRKAASPDSGSPRRFASRDDEQGRLHPTLVRRFLGLVAPAALLLALLRLAALIPAWSAYDAEVAELRAAFRAIPEGSRVLAVTPSGCRDPESVLQYNLANFAVIDRRSAVNTLFAGRGMQPIRTRDAALEAAPQIAMSEDWLTEAGRRRLPKLMGFAAADAFVHWRDHFDVVVEIHGRCASAISAPGLSRVAGSAIADVYLAK